VSQGVQVVELRRPCLAGTTVRVDLPPTPGTVRLACLGALADGIDLRDLRVSFPGRESFPFPELSQAVIDHPLPPFVDVQNLGLRDCTLDFLLHVGPTSSAGPASSAEGLTPEAPTNAERVSAER